MTLLNPFTSHSQEVPLALMDALRQAHRTVIFSGAGMSAESGIPTFRDAMHGLWAQFDPQALASPEGWNEDRARVWAWYEWRRGLVMRVKPHAGHLAIPQLAHALSRFTGHDVRVDVVTQNVDDLHERAGATEVQPFAWQPVCATLQRLWTAWRIYRLATLGAGGSARTAAVSALLRASLPVGGIQFAQA